MLTTRFGRLADIAREAAFVAAKVGATCRSGAGDVRQAVARTKQRAELPSRAFANWSPAARSGWPPEAEVGQVNGLAVLQAGPRHTDSPRITATIGAGSAGVINIEAARPTSAVRFIPKVFIFWADCCAIPLRTLHPLAFDASVAFEQSYGGIDGDSASGAEILLSFSAAPPTYRCGKTWP